ncbi:MAG: hypothetical protein ACXWRA_07935 [Pseudobdellovibrionaceae bacterium]
MSKLMGLIGFLLFSLKAESQTSLKIQVSQITNGMMAVPTMVFSAEVDSCKLENIKSKKTVRLSKEICQKSMNALQSDLAEPLGPSDYINPQQNYFEVKVTWGAKTWSRVVQQEQTTLCTADNKCTPPVMSAPWRIIRTLNENLAKYLEEVF